MKKMQRNTQAVCFKKCEKWFTNEVDLKLLYTQVHSGFNGYGSSANSLVCEMLANLLDLVRQGKVNLENLVITDYGCGQSTASNVLACAVSKKSMEITKMLQTGANYGEIVDFMLPSIKEANKSLKEVKQIEKYGGNITVQRYDIGVPQYSEPLSQEADVVFCNDVFEHIPTSEISAFIADLEAAGTYVVASISLRDAVNYSKIEEELLMDGAVEIEEPSGIILTQDESGCYIFSLHVSIMSPEKWQQILGNKWVLLSAQDYTACSAMNFEPSHEYQLYKKELIAQIGFADFIPFPTEMGTKYEQDQILFRRTAKMQPEKHIQKLKVLEGYADSTFKEKEVAKSKQFLKFVGIENNELCELSENWLQKLYALDSLAKEGAKSDAEAMAAAENIIAEYNRGNTDKIDEYIANM